MLAKIESYSGEKLPGVSDRKGGTDYLVVPHVDDFLEGTRITVRKCRVKKLEELKEPYGINIGRHWTIGRYPDKDEEYEVLILNIYDKNSEMIETYLIFGEAAVYIMNDSGKTIYSIKSNGYNLKA